MITRIKIDGFKSLLAVELYFGSFTCIAGPNAVGKSNFFDALVFLSQLADNNILHAAKSIRSENQRHSNVKDIFFRSGDQYLKRMKFEVDMIVKLAGEDDLGQPAKAAITSLRYVLELKLNEQDTDRELIEIVREELIPITQTEIKTRLFFEHSKEWLDSILFGRRSTKAPFISTEGQKIKLHQDGNKGRNSEFNAQKMPRTLLSTVTAESPTAFLAREEMRQWMMLQFEPSALRQPNSIFEIKNASITANGSNLPATLYRLHNENKDQDIYQQLTNKLRELVSGVDEIFIDRDDKRDLLTVQVRFRDGLILPAQSLSDGTLRFLGLATLESDSSKNSLICLEEPENGISPKKILEMIDLLVEMSMDTTSKIDDNNPFRQVIINSHAPLVVRNASDESLYLAKDKEVFLEEFHKKVRHTSFEALDNTWKTSNELVKPTSLGNVMTYLENIEENKSVVHSPNAAYGKQKKRTVLENVNQTKLDLFP